MQVNSDGSILLKNLQDSLQRKPLPIYNLFQLSKYLNKSASLSFEEKKELMNLLFFFIGKEKSDSLFNTNQFPQISELYRETIFPDGKIMQIFNNIHTYFNEKNQTSDINNLFRNIDIDKKDLTVINKGSKIEQSFKITNDEVLQLKDYYNKLHKLKPIISYKDTLPILSQIITPNESVESNISLIDDYYNYIIKELEIDRNSSSSTRLSKETLEQLASTIKGIKNNLNLKGNIKNIPNNPAELEEHFYKVLSWLTDVNQTNDTLKKYDYLIDDTKYNQTISNIKSLIGNIKAKADNLSKKYETQIFDILKAPIIGFLNKNVSTSVIEKVFNGIQTSEKVATSNTQSTITLIASLQQNTPPSAIGIPSETQIINAMAIFLAKRTKQEAIIWFMDQIRDNMSNPLIQDAFPETMSLLLSLEDYKAPNFSSGWRNAIAKDFVQLPINLINSVWIENVIFKDIHTGNNEENLNNLKELRIAVSMLSGIDSLISKKYGYRDIIRHFYLKNRAIEKSISSSSLKIFDALYIVINELFNIDLHEDNQKLRLLTYEELISLSKEDWKIFTTLIETKYKDELAELGVRFGDNKDKWALHMGHILQTLSQFDKMNQEVRQQSKEISFQNFHNVWQSISLIINTVNKISNDTTLIKRQNTLEPIKSPIARVQNIYNILSSLIRVYDNIYNQDFTSAAKHLFSIIDLNNPNQINTFKYLNYIIKLNVSDANNMEEFIIDVNSNNDTNYVLQIKKNKNGVKFIFSNPGKNKNQGKDLSLNLSTDQLRQIQTLIATNDKKVIKNINELLAIIICQSADKKDEPRLNRRFEATIDSIHTFTINVKQTLGIEITEILNLLKFAQFKLEPETIKTEFERRLLARNFEFYIPIANEKFSQFGIGKLNNKYMNKVIQLVSFFGDVATATSEEELANVINSHVLPPTSYKLKAKMRNSLDLNAYVGFDYGFLNKTSSHTTFESGFSWGITAPIGLTYSASTRYTRLFSTIGLHLGFIDLGNIVNHYLWKPNELYEKEIHFSEVFSPSLKCLASFRKMPLVLFGGFKAIPLKSVIITQESHNFNKNVVYNTKSLDAILFSLGFKIDIPLHNLYKKEYLQ